MRTAAVVAAYSGVLGIAGEGIWLTACEDSKLELAAIKERLRSLGYVDSLATDGCRASTLARVVAFQVGSAECSASRCQVAGRLITAASSWRIVVTLSPSLAPHAPVVQQITLSDKVVYD